MERFEAVAGEQISYLSSGDEEAKRIVEGFCRMFPEHALAALYESGLRGTQISRVYRDCGENLGKAFAEIWGKAGIDDLDPPNLMV